MRGRSPDINPDGRVYQLIKRDLDPNSPTYGNDQIVLDILGPNKGAQGVCMLQTFAGIYHAPRTPVRQSWAYQEGSTPSDFPRVEERTIDIRLSTQGVTQLDWERVDSQLWEVLRFDRDCILRIESMLSPPRELKVRLDRKPKDSMTFDTASQNLMIWEMTLVASDPWYYSATLTSSWTNTSGSGTGYITLQNPADVECWVQYSCNQIVSGTQVWTLPDGVALWPAGSTDANGHDISGTNVTHTLPSLGVGQEFLVDTYPLNPTLMVRDGSQAWARMNAEAFLYSLPPRTPPTQVPVKVTGGTTSTTLTAYMTQRWDRPWSV
jgi:hypothetical protein